MSGLMLVLLAPFGVLFALLCIQKPLTVALPLFAASIPFGSLIGIGHSRFSSLSSILGFLMLIGLTLRLVVVRKQRAPLSGTVFLWIAFVAVATTTALWSLGPSLTANGVLEIGSLVALYALISMNQIDREIVHRVEQGLIAGGLAAVGYGAVQLTLLGGFPNDVPGQPPGTRAAASATTCSVPTTTRWRFLLPLASACTASATAPKASTRRLHAVFAFLMFVGIVMTGSRGGMLAAVLCMLVLLAAAPRGRRDPGGTSSSPVSSPAWSPSSCTPSGSPSATVSTTSSSGRTSIWKVGLAACPQYCPLGSGWETFPIVYARTQPTVPGAEVLVGQGGSYQPHNVILLVAIELGVPGLLLFFAVLVAHRRSRRSRLPRAAARSAAGSPARHLSGLTVLVEPRLQVLLDGVHHGRPAPQRELPRTRAWSGGGGARRGQLTWAELLYPHRSDTGRPSSSSSRVTSSAKPSTQLAGECRVQSGLVVPVLLVERRADHRGPLDLRAPPPQPHRRLPSWTPAWPRRPGRGAAAGRPASARAGRPPTA